MTSPTRIPSPSEMRRRRPKRAAAPAVPTPSPHQLPPGWIHEYFRSTVEHRIRNLGFHLIYRRQIPNEFFRKFLVEEGVSQKDASYCNVRDWVSGSGQVLIHDEQKRLLVLLILMKVDFLLTGQPRDETHRDALRRLAQALNALLERGIPKSTIAQTLDLNGKVVDRILAGRDTHSTRLLNPWALADLVQDTDWQPRRRGSGESENLSVTDDEVARSRAKDRAAQKAGWLNPSNLPKITPDGRCHHCGAGGAHLYQVQGLPPAPNLVEYECRSCGRSSYQNEARRRTRQS